MSASRAIARLVAPACALLASVGLAGSQEPAQEKPAPPAFRGNINFVRVDAIVTDGDDRPVTDLQQADFEVFEDGRLQTVEQFRVVRIEQRPEADPTPIRDRHDEEREAARDDVRMFAIYVSPTIQAREYERAREALIRFVRTELYPSDMVAVTAPGMLGEVWFSRDREEIVRRLRRLSDPPVMQGGPTPVRAPMGRPQRATQSLEELALRLATLRDGRKSIIYVGEAIGSRMGELTLDFQELITTLNRTNTSVYVMDIKGLTTRSNFFRTINLRALAEDTGGIAIVNTNNYDANLKLVASDATFYYLLGYTSPAPNDGKFHRIELRVKRGGLQVRSRSGFLALTPEPIASPFPKPPEVAPTIKAALARIDPGLVTARYVETWVGAEASTDGRARVTVAWDLLSQAGEARRQPRYLAVVALDGADTVVFSRPDEGSGSRIEVGALTRAVSFDAPSGRVKVRVSVQDGDGGVLDSETRTVEVPDYSLPRATFGTPRVFRARNAREARLITSDPSPAPAATRTFSRTEQLIVRFDHISGGEAVQSALLNRLGQIMKDLPVAEPHPGTGQVELNLSSLPPGEYLIEIVAGEGAGERTLVPFRVRG